MAPPLTTMVGRSTLAAPISSAGVVLSQPVSSTTPSSGLARRVSSTSIDTRLRNSMVVGRIRISPSEVTGNSMGSPPASYTPRLTCSAMSRRWALHGVRSLAVWQMPMTGRPSKEWSGWPWLRSQERCTKPSTSSPPNHSWLRSRGRVAPVPGSVAGAAVAGGTGVVDSSMARR